MLGNNAITPQYNSRLVSAAEAPRNWEDLLNPKWKGSIGLAPNMRPWFTLALGEGGWGVEKTEDFLRKLRQQQIPKRSIAVAVAAAVVGMFLIPVVGLFVGFGAGLLASEYARRRDFRAALDSSVETLKATGLGILVEFGMACLAASVWMVGVIVHFTTR